LTASIYEARQRLGGRILSVTGAVGEGLVLDPGGHFINTNHADMLELANEFGLKLFNRTEDAARFPFLKLYYFNGKSAPKRKLNKLRSLTANF